MKIYVLTAALLAVTVLGAYAMLIVLVGGSFSDRPVALAPGQPCTVKLVPPMEWLEQRSQSRAGVTTVTTSVGAQGGNGSFHTKADSPKIRVFQTGYKGGTQIVFNHEKHVKDLGFQCIDCHHVERCGKCHLRDGENSMRVTRGKQALHESCLACHASSGGPQKCDECHKQ